MDKWSLSGEVWEELLGGPRKRRLRQWLYSHEEGRAAIKSQSINFLLALPLP